MEPVYYPKPAYREKDFFGRKKVPGIHPMAYQAVFQPEENWWVPSDGLTFSDDNLNLAVACVRKYNTSCSNLEWYHIQVSAVAFDSFFRAMEADHGFTVILPFWTWCDYGTEEQECHKHHRHMIVASPAGHFTPYVWEKIHVSKADTPDEQFQPILKNRIIKFVQLIDTIGFLSQRDSICVGMQPESQNNFFINCSLPKLFALSLATQFRNGLENLICDEYIHRPIMDFAPLAKWKDNMYKVHIKDLPEMPLNLVFPVSRNLKVTMQTTQYELHVLGKRKIHFEKDEQILSLSDKEWVKLQIERGNILSNIVGDYWWAPSKKQQYYLGVIIPLIKRKEELEAEIERLKGDMAAPPNKKIKC